MPRATLTEETIGDRLRRFRNERGLTREQLSERARVSVDLIRKLEQNRRQSARLDSITALSTALGVSRSDLLDKRPRLDEDPGLVLGLRDAIIHLESLNMPDVTNGEPASVEVLNRHVETGWSDYWGGRFGQLAHTLPELIAEARHTAAGGPACVQPLAQAYQLAACLLVHLGREDLAAISAERGITAAADGEDELQWATIHGTYCWALLSQARHTEAERLALNVAQRIEPQFSSATAPHITVWGGLVLWGLAAAVEDGRAEAAAEHLSLAGVGAARMTHGDRHDYQTNFGQTQVAMQATYAHAMLGSPDKALRAAGDVRREDLRGISYGRHLLDTAQAHLGARQLDKATAKLTEARTTAPVWFRHQALARQLVGEIVERRTRLTPALRSLVHSLEANR